MVLPSEYRSTLTVDEIAGRLRRLMRLGGDAAAQDADTATYETLDVAAREPATEGMLGLLGEIRRWHLAGRPDAAQAGRLMHQTLMLQYQDADQVVDATEYVDERLRELEQGYDDA